MEGSNVGKNPTCLNVLEHFVWLSCVKSYGKILYTAYSGVSECQDVLIVDR